MKRIGDRSFLYAWQAIRAATQPGPEASLWQVGEVAWRRHRVSHSCPDFAVVNDVHRLDHSGKNRGWSLLVVSETWWNNNHEVIRSQIWAAHLAGPRQLIQSWMMQQAETRQAKDDFPPARPTSLISF